MNGTSKRSIGHQIKGLGRDLLSIAIAYAVFFGFYLFVYIGAKIAGVLLPEDMVHYADEVDRWVLRLALPVHGIVVLGLLAIVGWRHLRHAAKDEGADGTDDGVAASLIFRTSAWRLGLGVYLDLDMGMIFC